MLVVVERLVINLKSKIERKIVYTLLEVGIHLSTCTKWVHEKWDAKSVE